MMRCLRELALALLLFGRSLSGQNLELRFLDVGQADAILIRNQGKTVLIDAGRSGATLSQLEALGVTSLDLFIVSHNHADHIGGADAVLNGLPVRSYMDNGMPVTTRIYARVISLVESKGITYLQATPRTITLGDATLRILPPPPAAGDQNASSIGVLLQRGRFRALMTGDSEQPELTAWLASDAIPGVDVLKAPHHGSRNGVTPGWIAQTRPKVVVISVGANNQYGHPDPWALRYYEASGRQVYRTDRDGDVVVRVAPDGDYEVTTERSSADAVSSGARLAPTPSFGQPLVPESLRAQGADSAPRVCCKICVRGKACGNTCIFRSYTCHQPPGCACDAQPQ